MRSLKRKRFLVPLAVVGALAASVTAFAYWTSGGTGIGDASVGTSGDVTIAPIVSTGTLYPGGSSSVSFTITNNSSSAPVQVDKVVADTTAGTNGITDLPPGCSAADFQFGDVTVNASIPPNGAQGASGTLSMTNTAANQDACKNATLVLHLTVDNSGL